MVERLIRCFSSSFLVLVILTAATVVFAGETVTSSITDSGIASDDILSSLGGIAAAFQRSILYGIEALLLAFVAITTIPFVRNFLSLGPKDRFDWVRPLAITLTLGFGAAALAQQTGQAWYVVVITGIGAVFGSKGAFDDFRRQLMD